MNQMNGQTDYVIFLQNIFADGTLSQHSTPETLLEALKLHKDFPTRATTFLVSGREMLNELAPVEVLAGKRFQAAIDHPVRVVGGKQGHAELVVLTATDNAAHRRVLERRLEERVIKVIYAARDYFDGPQY